MDFRHLANVYLVVLHAERDPDYADRAKAMRKYMEYCDGDVNGFTVGYFTMTKTYPDMTFVYIHDFVKWLTTNGITISDGWEEYLDQ